MLQLMIDVASSTPDALRRVADLLIWHASQKETGQDTKPAAIIETHTHRVGDVSITKTLTSIGPTMPSGPVIADVDTDAAVLAANFNKGSAVPTGTNMEPVAPSNVVPLFPQPSAPTVNTAGAPASPAPGLAAPAAAAPGVASVEVDSAKIPWDARIHSDTKSKKQDGTWKLRRGIDKALAETILAQHKNAVALATQPTTGLSGPTITPAAASAPVLLPPAIPVGGVPLPPAFPTASAGLPAPGAAPGLPFPVMPAPGGTLPPAIPGPLPPGTPAEQFRAMMVRIGNALAAKTITNEQVAEAHIAEGLAQLQLAIVNPEKMPAIMARLGV